MDLLLRRRMMMQAAQERTLPSEYEQIAYIESNTSNSALGTYIDTGIVLGSNPTVELDYQVLSSPTNQDICGDGEKTDCTMIVNTDTGYSLYLWRNGGWVLANGLTGDNAISNRNKYVYTNNSFSVNGTTIFSYAPPSTLSTNTFTIFRGRPSQFTNNGVVYRSHGRLFMCKIIEGDELVCDLVPALRTADGIAGMYDFVSGNFLTNAYYSTTIGGYPNFLYER